MTFPKMPAIFVLEQVNSRGESLDMVTSQTSWTLSQQTLLWYPSFQIARSVGDLLFHFAPSDNPNNKITFQIGQL